MTSEELKLRVDNEIDSAIGDSLADVAGNPLRFLGRIAKAANAVKDSISATTGMTGNVLEDFVVAKALSIFDSWANGDNPKLTNWYEDTFEATLRKLLETSIRAAL